MFLNEVPESVGSTKLNGVQFIASGICRGIREIRVQDWQGPGSKNSHLDLYVLQRMQADLALVTAISRAFVTERCLRRRFLRLGTLIINPSSPRGEWKVSVCSKR